MRRGVPDNILATVCLLSGFPTHHVPSMRDDELLDCLRHVVQPHSTVSAVAMLAAESVARLHNANEVRRHVLSASEALSVACDRERQLLVAFQGCRRHVGYVKTDCWEVLQLDVYRGPQAAIIPSKRP